MAQIILLLMTLTRIFLHETIASGHVCEALPKVHLCVSEYARFKVSTCVRGL